MNKQTLAAKKLSKFVENIFRINGLILKIGEEITKPSGQTSARWQILGAISDRSATVSQIAAKMGLTRQSVQRVANILITEKLASLETNPTHKKAKLLKLTAKGKKVHASIRKLAFGWTNELSEKMGESTLEEVNIKLEVIETILKNHRNDLHE